MQGKELIQFDNGLRLVFVKKPEGKVRASLKIYFLVGSEDEETPRGIAHLLEHSVFKGTSEYSQEELSIELNKICANANASTSVDFTNYRAKFPKSNINRVFELFSAMIFDSVFDTDELEKEKNVIIEEINMCKDDPPRFAFQNLMGSMFMGTGMGSDIAGEPELLKTVTRDDLIGFRNTHYIPQNTIISVSGDLDRDIVKNLVEKYFVKRFCEINGEELTLKKYTPTYNRPANLVVKNNGLIQSNVMMGIYIMDYLSEDKRKFKLINFILGGSMSSRLFKKLRNELGLCYSIYSDTYLYKNNGVMLIDFSTTKKNRQKAIEMVRDEIDNILKNGITQEEFETAKSVIVNTFLMEQDDQPYVNLTYLAFSGELDDPKRVLEELESMSKDDCEAVFRKYVDTNNIHISVVE